ncbi:MAG TPA: MFS transporter, partial [Candidatus Dormibacteraeota bacterium]|nr:MFS transporter [Candidatus Dormibacteraeota bacterium]
MSSKTQTLEIASPSSQSVIFYLLSTGFVFNGIVISLIGPILPMFMAKWGLNDSQAGLFSLIQFSCSFVGVLLSSPLISAKGFRPAITMGLAFLGLGFALLNAPRFLLALAASGIYGLGYGFATPGTNLWVGESYGARRASALSIVNLAWGAGAISSSPLAMLAMRTSHVSLLLYLVGALGVALAFALLRMPFGKPPHEENSVLARASDKVAGTGVAVLLGILFFVYVGTEVGTSYWAPTHAERATN